jgi:CubicO group peptidase (beta-lactamase class C family)/transposase
VLDINALPTDVTQLKRLLIEHHELVATQMVSLRTKQRQIEHLKFQLAKLRRFRFGQSSERLEGIEQMVLSLEELEASIVQAQLPASAATDAAAPDRGQPTRRKHLPEHFERFDHTIEPSECACPDCGGPLGLLGTDTSEVLEVKTVSFTVARHIRPKKRCSTCSVIVQAPAPSRPIEKSFADASRLALILSWKYAFNLPLYRQCQIFAHAGLTISRTTLMQWVGASSELLGPLMTALAKHVLAAPNINADDTPIKVLAPGTGKAKKGRLWTYVRDGRGSGPTDPPASNRGSLMRFTRFPFSALIILFATTGPLHADQIDDYINHEIHAKHIPGMAIVALKDGVVVKEKAYGTANLEFMDPGTLQDVYPIASITKLFTAVAVFMLVQDGKIHLEDKITDLLPALPASWRDVTVLNCLSHTSGIPDFPQIYDSWSVPLSQEDALAAIFSKTMVYRTGEKSAYNQAEFLLLKMIIANRSGMSFEEFLNRRIFTPSGIQSARFGDSRDIFTNGVTVYTRATPAPDRFHSIPLKPFVNRANDPLFHADLLYPAYTHASAGLYMTAPDLAKLDSALWGGKLLKEKFLQQMWTPFRLKDGSLGDFTAGWQHDVLNGHRLVGHIGAGMAVYSSLIDDHFTLILLTNVQETKVWDLSQGILQIYVPGIVGASKQSPARAIG